MQIDKEDIDEFVRIYAKEYGVELSRAEASEIAFDLVSIYELLCKPLPSEKPSATGSRLT